ncbi:hypothetical protein SAMD00023353_5100570 [Rosellinia necatrix]|uniref:Uncharacterized protein n=1 Tax=Rosellinia necatrix TaxID=77044 RepID=A0A1S8A9R1_ROSNE|nr:hypothetical protein SAMD00023353_5100570 [Rosellinia necatrix]
MPVYITTEQFSCGHERDTLPKYSGTDGEVVKKTLDVLALCLSCTCYMALDASVTGQVPQRHVQDLTYHVWTLGQTASETMRHELRAIEEQLQCLDDLDKFQKGVIALAGYPEVGSPIIL